MRYLTPNRIIRSGVESVVPTGGNSQIRVPPEGIAIWYVSGFIGNDNTGNGSLNKPFRTITKAQAVASAGELVFVLPGLYDEALLGKNGIYYYFEMGAKVVSTANGDNHLWFLPQAMSVWVGGYGEFIGNGTVRLQNDNSKLFMECLRLERPVTADFPCVSVVGGDLHLLVKEDILSINHYAVNIRNNSRAYIEVKKDITTVSPAGGANNNCLNFTTVSNTEKSIIKARSIQILADPSLPASNRNTTLFISSSPNASLQVDAGLMYNNHIAVEEYNYQAVVSVDSGIKNLEINANLKAVGRFGIAIYRGVAGSEITINGDIESQLNRAVLHSAAGTKLTLNGKTIGYAKETIALGKADYFAYQTGGTLVVNGPVINKWNDIRGNAITNYNGNLIVNPSAERIMVTHPDAKAIFSPLMDKTIKIQGRVFANRAMSVGSPQEDTVIVIEVQNNTDYTDTINGTPITFHSPSIGSTASVVVAGLVGVINGSGLPFVAIDNFNGSYQLKGVTNGQSFTHGVSSNLSFMTKVLPSFSIINQIGGGDLIIDQNIE